MAQRNLVIRLVRRDVENVCVPCHQTTESATSPHTTRNVEIHRNSLNPKLHNSTHSICTNKFFFQSMFVVLWKWTRKLIDTELNFGVKRNLILGERGWFGGWDFKGSNRCVFVLKKHNKRFTYNTSCALYHGIPLDYSITQTIK